MPEGGIVLTTGQVLAALGGLLTPIGVLFWQLMSAKDKAIEILSDDAKSARDDTKEANRLTGEAVGGVRELSAAVNTAANEIRALREQLVFERQTRGGREAGGR